MVTSARENIIAQQGDSGCNDSSLPMCDSARSPIRSGHEQVPEDLRGSLNPSPLPLCKAGLCSTDSSPCPELGFMGEKGEDTISRKNQIEPKQGDLLLPLLSPRDEFEQGDLLPPMTSMGVEMAFFSRQIFPCSNSEDDASSCGRRSSVHSSMSGTDSLFDEDNDTCLASFSEESKAGVLGLTLMRRRRKDGLLVKRVRAGGPAASEGSIEEGDVIWSIDGVAFRGKSETAHSLADLMRGPDGSIAILEVRKSRTSSRVVKTVRIQRVASAGGKASPEAHAVTDPRSCPAVCNLSSGGWTADTASGMTADVLHEAPNLRSSATSARKPNEAKGAGTPLSQLNLPPRPCVIGGGKRTKRALTYGEEERAIPGLCGNGQAGAGGELGGDSGDKDKKLEDRSSEGWAGAAQHGKCMLRPPSLAHDDSGFVEDAAGSHLNEARTHACADPKAVAAAADCVCSEAGADGCEDVGAQLRSLQDVVCMLQERLEEEQRSTAQLSVECAEMQQRESRWASLSGELEGRVRAGQEALAIAVKQNSALAQELVETRGAMQDMERRLRREIDDLDVRLQQAQEDCAALEEHHESLGRRQHQFPLLSDSPAGADGGCPRICTHPRVALDAFESQNAQGLRFDAASPATDLPQLNDCQSVADGKRSSIWGGAVSDSRDSSDSKDAERCGEKDPLLGGWGEQFSWEDTWQLVPLLPSWRDL